MELEITEGLLIENMRYGQAVLTQLRSMGLHISLDDFGTGYSSLSYLKNLPLDYLKMDGSFVRHLAAGTADAENAQAIARTIIMLAHSLHLKVVAEGVETNEQLTVLCGMRCDQMQGYLFSRPLPPEEITQLLQQNASA
jgi:EAL domain-containing protein (putative c-di-GMP-specific phosphodiesterase class I)